MEAGRSLWFNNGVKLCVILSCLKLSRQLSHHWVMNLLLCWKTPSLVSVIGSWRIDTSWSIELLARNICIPFGNLGYSCCYLPYYDSNNFKLVGYLERKYSIKMIKLEMHINPLVKWSIKGHRFTHRKRSSCRYNWSILVLAKYQYCVLWTT